MDSDQRKADKPKSGKRKSRNCGAAAQRADRHPEARAERASKDAAPTPGPSPFEARPAAEHLRVTEHGATDERAADKRSAWLRKLDQECPYQVVLPRRQLAEDSAILDFLIRYVGKFDMYVEDDYAAFVRYCFEDELDAEIFRSRFEPKAERFKLAG